MKILFLTRFYQQGASSRMRSLHYLPWFESAAIEAVVSPLFDDSMLLRKYRHGDYSSLGLLSAYWQHLCALIGRDEFDLVWIFKGVIR